MAAQGARLQGPLEILPGAWGEGLPLSLPVPSRSRPHAWKQAFQSHQYERTAFPWAYITFFISSIANSTLLHHSSAVLTTHAERHKDHCSQNIVQVSF